MSPIVLTELGIERELKPHAKKARLPIVLTVLGNDTDVNLVQLSKACSPIEVTPTGMVTEVKERQYSKA